MGENPEMVLHQELRFNIDLNHTLICTVNSNNEHFDPWLDLEIHGETRADLGGKQVDSWSCFGFLTCCISVVTTLQLGWFARMTSVLFFQIETSDFCPYDFVFEKLSGVKPSKCLKYTKSYRVFKKFGSHVTRLYYSSEAIQRYSPPCLKMSPRVFCCPQQRRWSNHCPSILLWSAWGIPTSSTVDFSETIGEIGDLLGEELERGETNLSLLVVVCIEVHGGKGSLSSWCGRAGLGSLSFRSEFCWMGSPCPPWN